MGTSGKEMLRGLGQELLDMLVYFRRDYYHWDGLLSAWPLVFERLVPMETSGLRYTIANVHDISTIMGHGERLLDMVIRLASESEWAEWLDVALRLAACTGNAHMFDRLHAVGGDEMVRCHKMLELAAEGGNTHVLSALVAAGAAPLLRETREPSGALWPLQIAAINGHVAFVKGLAAAGAPLEYKWAGSGTALTLAVQAGHEDVVNELLAAGADINTTIEDSLRTGDAWSCLIRMVDYTPLCIAVAKNDEDMVQLLIDAGADLGDEWVHRRHPLHMAAERGFCGCLERLLVAGANVRYVDFQGISALHLAAYRNAGSAVDILLRHGADEGALTHRGQTPMEFVAKGQQKALHDSDEQSRWDIVYVSHTPRHAYAYLSVSRKRRVVAAADSIRQALRRASCWTRRGWLVMMRARNLALGPSNVSASSVNALSGDAAMVDREEQDGAMLPANWKQSTGTWCDAVNWLLRCPGNPDLFQNIVRFL